MDTGARPLEWLRNAVVGVFVAALCSGIFLPLYTDEVGWRLQERAGLDGVDKLFTELCGPNTLAQPPFWMMPARYYSALFNSLFAEPIYVRLSGILYALVFTGLLLLLIRRVTDRARDRIALSTMAIGFLSLGTMPLLLVWSRPEQPILLAFTGAMVIAASAWKQPDGDTSGRVAWLRSLAILLLALVALSYHFKAAFTIPLFLACLLFASRGRSAHVPRVVVALLLVGVTLWAAQYWVHRLECPADASVRADFARNNTGVALVGATGWAQIGPLIGKALSNVSLVQYLGMPAPREEPMSSWLPPHQIGFDSSFAWFLVMVAVWSIVLLLAAACLYGAARRAWRERRLEPRSVFALALVVTVLGWSATQGFRNVYEATFIVPMMVLAVIFAFSAHDGGGRIAGGIKLASAGVGLIGLVSIALVGAIYGPSLARAVDQRGYIAGQPYSISVFGYAGLRRDMLAAARQCGIVDPGANHALLIDDVTYFTFMQSKLPQHRQGLFTPIITTQDKIGYLRGIGSDGMIASCHALPPEIRARAKRVGQFCCLGPPDW